MVKTTNERVSDHRKSRMDAGLVRVEVWVPAKFKERLKRYAKKLESEDQKQGEHDGQL